jgi:two-component system response regulator NreC
MTTILLADDHVIVRQGVHMLLESEPDLQVVGEAGTGEEVLQLVGQLHPDILILDVMMPGMKGIEVVRRVHHRWPKTELIVLSMYDTEAYVVEALQAGASAYVLKRATSDELLFAIKRVLAGGLYLSPPLDERAIQIYINRTHATRLDPFESLTTRQREVLSLALEGYSNQQIAEELSLSPRTVEMHRATLMHKLGVRNQAELVHLALCKGWPH